MRLRATAAFPLSERKPGRSGVWTPPVSQEGRAPHAFRSALRAPLHARETRSPVCAGRAAGFGFAFGLHCARLDRVSRASGPGRRGVAPRLAAGPWADLWRLGPSAPTGSPQALHRPRRGAVRFRGRRAVVPWPHAESFGPVAAPLRRPAGAPRLRAYRLAAVVARTVARPCESLRQLSGATAGLGTGVAPSASRVRPPSMATLIHAGQSARACGTCALLRPFPGGLRPWQRSCRLPR